MDAADIYNGEIWTWRLYICLKNTATAVIC